MTSNKNQKSIGPGRQVGAQAARLRPTSIDYLLAALSPALIIGMIGCLVFFLLTLVYEGDFTIRLMYILGLYTFASVLIARIAIEQSRALSMAYMIAMGTAAMLVVMRFIQFPSGLQVFAFPIVLGFLILIAVLADRITFDCTVIDEQEDSSGEGLLQSLGLLKSQLRTGKPDAASKQSVQSPSKKKSRKHNPGVWVLYFALMAVPLFGIGQLFMSGGDSVGRSRSFMFLFGYLLCALSLLVVTSFLNLRRYLRQRQVAMPADMTVTWLSSGIIGVVFLLLAAMLLPLPGRAYGLFDLPFKLTSGQLKASKWGWGPEGVKDSSTKSNFAAPQDQKNGAPGGKSDRPKLAGGNEATKAGQNGQSKASGGDNKSNQGQGGDQKGQGEKNSSGQSGQSQSNDSSQNLKAQNNNQSNSSGGDKSNSSQSAAAKDKGSNSSSNNQSNNNSPKSNESNAKNDPSASQAKNQNDAGSKENKSAKTPSPADSGKPQNSPPQQQQSQQSEQTKSNEQQKNDANSEPRNQPNDRGKEQQRGQLDQEKNRNQQAQQKQNEQTQNEQKQNEQKQNEQKQGESQHKQTEGSKSDASQNSSSWNLSNALPNLTSLAKWITALILVAIISVYLLLHGGELWAAIRGLFDRLFGVDKPEAKTSGGQSDEPATVNNRHQAFSSFRNPFARNVSEGAQGEVVRYTFDAVQAWGYEHGVPRKDDETPEEYLRRLSRQYPNQSTHLQSLGSLYYKLAYANRQIRVTDIEPIRKLCSWLWSPTLQK